jgi:predicted transcriptional regulator
MKLVHEILQSKGGHIWAIEPDAWVYDAIAMMAEHQIGALLVMTGKEMLGIVSERDYARKVILRDKSSKATRVSEIMTHEVIHVDSHLHVGDCVQIMKENHVRHLPVIDEGVIVGMLSLRDLFSTIIDDQASTIDQLQQRSKCGSASALRPGILFFFKPSNAQPNKRIDLQGQLRELRVSRSDWAWCVKKQYARPQCGCVSKITQHPKRPNIEEGS